MPPVNVDNLMRELSIDQLIQVQLKLRNETENKREDLRQMVGRRYRDVLDASNAVKRLTEIASELSILLNDTKRSFSAQQNTESISEYTKRAVINAGRRLLLLHTLLPIIASTSDLLTRSFALCIAENLQRQLQTEQHHLLDKKDENVPLLLSLLSERLFQSRSELLNEIGEAIGFEVDWRSVTTLLAAQALLKPRMDISELLQLYLESRMKIVSEVLHQHDSTLLGLVRHIKDTIQCVEQTFGRGQGFLSAIQFITKKGWAPEEIKQLVEDQPLSTSRILETEIALVNGGCFENKFKLQERNVIQLAFSDWINEVCSIARDRVKAMCNHFERVEQAVEFAVAIGQIFKTDWLTNSFIEEDSHSNNFSTYSLIYRQLFDTTLLERFYQLIDEELILLENKLHTKLPLINCKPQMPFQRSGIAAVKFDPQLASGISTELQELVQEFSEQLLQLQKNVHKYTNVGQEENVGELHNILAERVLLMVERLTNFSEWKIDLIKPITEQINNQEETNSLFLFNNINENIITTRELREKWLSIFRLLLALVQHEPSILCNCMNHNLERIVNCNKMLHNATEEALCQFMNCIINEHFRASNLYSQILENVTTWNGWMDLLQEPEHVKLSETVEIFVPTQISSHFYILLVEICSELNQNSLGHLFTRNVTLHVSKQIGHLFTLILQQCSNNCVSIPAICVQLIFDCKAFFQMFPDKQFLEISKQIETKMDPIEMNILQEPLLRNAKLFAQRTAMMFGQLQSEPITAFNKEAQLEESYSSLVDLIPRVQDVQRLAQIPRLSKFRDSNQWKGDEKNSSKNLSTKSQQRQSSKSPQRLLGESIKGQQSSSSFSSLYDKISTSWFRT
ncbi:hypothetical protein ACQ4LE_006836 [Meloidogyne hapla]|uniref:Conserved oligomeric Golgi complex subunit 1 n=1 Tax=Meloidogyne hapla TaxID=6305 RepID=A0A1I8BXE0_MELHA